jgi:hypothetical protein
MPSLQDLLDDRKKYADDMKITLADGVESTLGELRGGFMKDADYRQKTSHVAREREALASERMKFDQDRQEAEAQLAAMVERSLNPRGNRDPGQDEVDAFLARDPAAKRLADRLAATEAKFTELEKRTKAQDERLAQQQQAMLADQHRRALAMLKSRDADLDEQQLVQFAQENAIPRLDMAYRLLTEDKRWKAEADKLHEKAAKEGYEKAKRELAQPQLPQRRVAPPVPETAPKSFDEAADMAARDPEILATMEGQFLP